MKKGGVPWVNSQIRPFLTQEETPYEERYDKFAANARDVLAGIFYERRPRNAEQGDQAEVIDYIACHWHERDANNHRLVVRKGYAAERELQTPPPYLKGRTNARGNQICQSGCATLP